MINSADRLTVLHDDNSVFVDYTDEAADYLRDTFTLGMVALEDKLMIGFSKPINALYVELETVGTASKLSGKYWNGTAWVELEGFYDDSKGLSRNGFVQWDRNQTDEAKTTVDSKEMYWYQISIDADSSAEVTGLNIVFNDLEDLKSEFWDVVDLLPENVTSPIGYLVNARNYIVQKLRTKGYNAGGELLSPWDILNIEEVRQASTYYALHKIYFNNSDEPEDAYDLKSAYFKAEAEKIINSLAVSVDDNDNGLAEAPEVLRTSKSFKLTR